MQVILHAGAQCTDGDRLARTLKRNAPALRSAGVAVPRPSAYRTLLGGAMNALTGARPAPDAREIFLQEILREDGEPGEATGKANGRATGRAPLRRLVLSSENFFTVPKRALRDGTIYPRAGERVRNLQKLFGDCEIALFIGLRNPATWLPAMLEATPHAALDDLLDGSDPRHLRWYELLHRLRDEAPGVAITAWCNEDTPLLWGEIVRAMLGLPAEAQAAGDFDMLSEIMSEEGMRRFRGYLRLHPDLTQVQKRRVMTAFLETFALADRLEQEIDLPGWSAGYVDALARAYEDDVRQIAGLDGVTLLAP